MSAEFVSSVCFAVLTLFSKELKEEFNQLISQLNKTEAWVKINQNTLCIVDYPSSMVTKLAHAVEKGELSALDRIELLLDMKRLCNAQRVKPSDVLKFLERYLLSIHSFIL